MYEKEWYIMKILYYDCFSGISGDMNLAALIDLGVDPNYLRSQLSRLELEGYIIRVSRDVRHAISGTRVDVMMNGHDHHDHHDHHNHRHEQGNTQEHDQHHEHEHRNLEDIRKIVENSSLTPFVKESSMKMFRLIAEAEAKVH